jgi:hypothetical protein
MVVSYICIVLIAQPMMSAAIEACEPDFDKDVSKIFYAKDASAIVELEQLANIIEFSSSIGLFYVTPEKEIRSPMVAAFMQTNFKFVTLAMLISFCSN